MADYSGYTPQRRQQPQDPWADAAVGIAKLFMPDPEMQAKGRQSQQQEDYNAARLNDVKAGTAWTQTREEYDRAKLNEHGSNQKLHAERGKILARAAAEGRDLNPAEAARLVAINGQIRGTVSPGEVSGFFAIPGAKKKAADKAAATDLENKNKDALRIKSEQEKADLRVSDEFKALHTKHSAPLDVTRLENNLMAMFEATQYARENGLHLTREAASAIAIRGQEAGYTEAEMVELAKRMLLKMEDVSAAGTLNVAGAKEANMRIKGKPKYTPEQIEAYRKNFKGDPALWAAEERNYKGARDLDESDVAALDKLGARDPKVLRVRGTPAFIRAFAIKNPGKKILFMDTTTGRYGGGVASASKTVEEGFEPELGDEDVNFQNGRLLQDWQEE